MMKRNLLVKTLGIVALSGLVLGSVAARADAGYRGEPDRYHQVDRHEGHGVGMLHTIGARQQRQMDRIRHGVGNDRLNRHEYSRLMDEQRRIRMVKQRFMDDGRLNVAEFKRLNHLLDRADSHIKMAKWNDHGRGPDRS
jgi:hypothetical protein